MTIMKKIFPVVLAMVVVSMFFWPPGESRGAGMATGHTWTNAEIITHTKLNQMVNEGTVTNITTGDIADLANTLAKQAADSVNSSKVVNNSLLGGASGDLATNTVTTQNILIGSFNGTEFSNSVVFATGTYNWTNAITLNFSSNQIASAAVLAITNRVSAAAASNQVIKATEAGYLATSFLNIERGGAVLSTNILITAAYQTLASFTTTNTAGTIMIWASVSRQITGAGDLGVWGIQIYNGSSPLSSATADDVGGDSEAATLNCHWVGDLTAATTFSVRGISAAAVADDVFCGGTTNTTSDADVLVTNPTRINYIVIP